MEYWRKEYEQKLCTAEEAIKLIKSGDHLLEMNFTQMKNTARTSITSPFSFHQAFRAKL